MLTDLRQCYLSQNAISQWRSEKLKKGEEPSIHPFSRPAYPWEVAGAAAQVGVSKHLDPLQQRIDALLECQGETNYDLLRNLAIEFWDGL